VLGTVTYQDNPVSNATVRARNVQGDTYTTMTNEYGDFVISNIIGYHKVWAVSNDLVSYQQEITIEAGDYNICNIDLVQSASIPGQVTYNNSGVSGASIIATNVNSGRVFFASTNTSGDFLLTGMPGATYYIQVQKEGYIVNESFPTVQVMSGQTTDPLLFTLSYTGNTISGSANDSSTQEGIPGVNISLKQNGEILNNFITDNSGSFVFSSITDGNYVLSASHGAYDPVSDINVSVLNGVSNPAQAQFLMHPKNKVIYGTVTNSKLQPLPLANVTAQKDTIIRVVATDENGQYSISVPEFGTYSVIASRQYYTDSTPVDAVLTESNPTAQLSFQLTQLPSSISGNITITDQSVEPFEVVNPSQMIITLNIPDSDPVIVNVVNTSSYSIPNINLPIDNFDVQLQIVAQYNQAVYKKVQPLTLTPGENTVFNHNFDYIPNSVNLGGFVKMKMPDESFIIPTSTKVTLSNQSGLIDSVNTSSEGYYQFNSLVESDFPVSLQIKAEYDFETFETVIENIAWTGDNLEVNHFFDYILCSYQLSIKDHLNQPFKFVSVRITGNSLTQPINLITDENGYVSTDSTLHTGTYSVKITPPSSGSDTYLAPNSYTIQFSQLSSISDTKILPLKFNHSQIIPVSSLENISMTLTKAPNYTDPVILHYKDLQNVWREITMNSGSTNTELTASIPAQNRSGNIEFYFVSESQTNGLTYSSQNEPDQWLITAAGIISANNSSLTPGNSLITFNQRLRITADINDELENSLNELIDANGEVIWTLADSTLGELSSVQGSKRSIDFISPLNAENYAQNLVNAKVKLNDITINLSASVTIKEMRLSEIFIDGADEVSNSIINNYYRVIAKSDSGEVMTISPNVQSILEEQGSITVNGDLIKFTPKNDFIGIVALKVSASDPNHSDIMVENEKRISVYKLITPQTPADTLFTGLGCNLYLPEGMLSNGTANIYINHVQVSPVQQYGTAYDVEGKVFHTLSSGNPNFNFKPGISFDVVSAENLSSKTIATWDFDRMQWIHLVSQLNRSDSSVLVEEIPGWGQFALLSPSLALGLYDLKLLPNPFTPHDQIGSNSGLQISFKIASKNTRYPKVTCKVYNLNGSLVRTIVNQKAFLKGEYNIGESTSLYWDGRTDDHRMARNGRYVIHLVVEDAKDRKEYVKPVVLIK
jgi:hypothetical protein